MKKKKTHKRDCAWMKIRAKCTCGKVSHKLARRVTKMTKDEERKPNDIVA